MTLSIVRRYLIPALVALLAFATPSFAKEVDEIRVTRQFGLSFVPLMVMEHNKLIEKHGKALGLPDLKGSFIKLASTAAINDALLSGQIDFAPNGGPSLVTIWDRTRGTAQEIKGVAAIVDVPMWLNVNRPGVNSIRDLTDQDKIAITAVKVSIPAIILQMAAEKEWGPENYSKLDKLTVSMSHPDGMAAFLSRREISGHFTTPPYMYQELEQPGIKRILSSYDVMGGQTTLSYFFASSKFRENNPLAYKAFIAALRESIDFVNKNKAATAEIYLKVSGDKSIAYEEVLKQLNDRNTAFSVVPRNIMKYADFMHRTGSIKNKPASWKDLFFPEIHDQPGS